MNDAILILVAEVAIEVAAVVIVVVQLGAVGASLQDLGYYGGKAARAAARVIIHAGGEAYSSHSSRHKQSNNSEYVSRTRNWDKIVAWVQPGRVATESDGVV